MIPRLAAPTARLNPSPGQRPGNSATPSYQALKGRPTPCPNPSTLPVHLIFSTKHRERLITAKNRFRRNTVCFWNDKGLHTMNGMYGTRPPFQGFGFVRGIVPRPLPRAGLDRPLGLMNLARWPNCATRCCPSSSPANCACLPKPWRRPSFPPPTRRRLAPRGASLRPTKTVKILFMQTDKVMLKGYANRAFAAHQNRIHPGTCHRFGGDDRQTD